MLTILYFNEIINTIIKWIKYFMKIITGLARGKSLKTLNGDSTRPTTERVKEGLFSSIQFEIEGRRVLDLFAGSGQLGLEALSRGALECDFVDSSPDAVSIIKDNVSRTGLSCARVYRSDSLLYLSKCKNKYDIVFLDPPYNSGLLSKSFNAVLNLINSGGIIVCEHPSDYLCPEVDNFRIKSYKYGAISITIYRLTVV